MISSSNADFNEDGFSSVVRDLERAYLMLSELGVTGGDSPVSTVINFDGSGQFPASNFYVGPSQGPNNSFIINNVIIGGEQGGFLPNGGNNGSSGGTLTIDQVVGPESVSNNGGFVNPELALFTITPSGLTMTDAQGNTATGETGIGVGTKINLSVVPFVFPSAFSYNTSYTGGSGNTIVRTVGMGESDDVGQSYSNLGGVYSKWQIGAHNFRVSISNTNTGGVYGNLLYCAGNVGSTSNSTDNSNMLTQLRYLNGITSRTTVSASTLGSWSNTYTDVGWGLNPTGIYGISIPPASSSDDGATTWDHSGYRVTGAFRKGAGSLYQWMFGINAFSTYSSSIYYYLNMEYGASRPSSFTSTFVFPGVISAAITVTSGTYSGTIYMGSSAGLTIDSSTGYMSINGNQVIQGRLASITAPSGGATIDSQARTAINTIISRLQSHGLIS